MQFGEHVANFAAERLLQRYLVGLDHSDRNTAFTRACSNFEADPAGTDDCQ